MENKNKFNKNEEKINKNIKNSLKNTNNIDYINVQPMSKESEKKQTDNTINFTDQVIDEEDVKEIVSFIHEEFDKRSKNRKLLEANWLLNINFYNGNQYVEIDGNDELAFPNKQYYWEERQVFNHIAPLVELRLSKLSRVRPKLNVLPFSDNQHDIMVANVSSKILKATTQNLNLSQVLSKGTTWSEICGSSFYKVGWNSSLGKTIAVNEIGHAIKEGEVDIEIVSPFEIYPDSNTYENIQDCASIIYAKAFHKDEVKNIWGVDLEGKDIDVYSSEFMAIKSNYGSKISAKTIKSNQVLVLEYYEKPSIKFPCGRLIIVADDKLLYIGELPYINQSDEKRGFPFIRQIAMPTPNSLFGTSIIERCIPIQRSFNFIKNRKHEFLHRLTMGVMAVEDGSIDLEDLEESGLAPGKVLVYRQGGTGPKLMTSGSVPTDFQLEENQLLNEFLNISGVSDLLNTSSISTNISGVALQLLIEQDEVRLLTSAESIRNVCKDIGKQILRLYKQFAIIPKTTRILDDEGKIEMLQWQNSDINSDDIVFETESELNETLAQRRSMLLDILNTGLLNDENGKLSNATRAKLLEQLGFGIWENAKDSKSLHIKSANNENYELLEKDYMPDPLDIDDHELHINEHICFLLSNELDKYKNKKSLYEKLILDHIKKHKQFNALTKKIENSEQI